HTVPELLLRLLDGRELPPARLAPVGPHVDHHRLAGLHLAERGGGPVVHAPDHQPGDRAARGGGLGAVPALRQLGRRAGVRVHDRVGLVLHRGPHRRRGGGIGGSRGLSGIVVPAHRGEKCDDDAHDRHQRHDRPPHRRAHTNSPNPTSSSRSSRSGPATRRAAAAGSSGPASPAEGQSSARTQAPHAAVRAWQTRRPWKMMRWLASVHPARGSSLATSRSTRTGSVASVHRHRCTSRMKWVSTVSPGTPNALPNTTLAVFLPKPGSVTRSSSRPGTSPSYLSTSAAPSPWILRALLR